MHFILLATNLEAKMNSLSEIYFTTERYLFPMVEEEIGEISEKMKEFLRIVEIIRPARFLTDALRWCGLGRPMKDREHILRSFFMKSVYDFPTTKVLIENLKTNPSLRYLCGWESRSAVPSEATFSRAFSIFASERILEEVHTVLIQENYKEKLVGHASIDSTAIEGREKACQIADKKQKIKKKRGRKSKAEKEAMQKSELAEIHTRRLALQGGRRLEANLEDLPQGCDWGGKRDSKGNTYHWRGYKLHLAIGDGGVPLAAVLSSASLHDSQVAIPLMQKVAERATVLYDLADSGYDAGEIKAFSRKLGHVPIIDCNKRRGEYIPFAPAEQRRYCERSTVERGNSDLKDNYGARHVRVKGHWKVLCHLMFGVIAIAVKQLFNMIV